MDEKLWYAVQRDEEDNEWGFGSHDYQEAVRMARNMGDGARIAVIAEGNDPVCVNIILQEDF